MLFAVQQQGQKIDSSPVSASAIHTSSLSLTSIYSVKQKMFLLSSVMAVGLCIGCPYVSG